MERICSTSLTGRKTMNDKTLHYGAALLVIVLWSLTFISTKVLLRALAPVEILFYRYLLGYVTLCILYPRLHRPQSLRGELLFAGAGLCGGTLYFLAENYALAYSTASNVSLLLAAAPLFTAVAAHMAAGEPFTRRLAAGSLIALAGVALVVGNGRLALHLHPLGDLLALSAAGFWAVYSILIKRIGGRLNGLYVTRKILFYTLLTLLPAFFLSGAKWRPDLLQQKEVLLNLLFLGVAASSGCVWLWNRVIWKLGAATATNLIYLVPLLTLLEAAVLLSERITWGAVLGGLLILAGVVFAGHGARS